MRLGGLDGGTRLLCWFCVLSLGRSLQPQPNLDLDLSLFQSLSPWIIPLSGLAQLKPFPAKPSTKLVVVQ